MTTYLDRTIEELDNIVRNRLDPSLQEFKHATIPWILDLLFVLPKNDRATPVPVMFDGVWITVWAGSEEQDALNRAGLNLSSAANVQRTGGTESVMAEFHNAFIELALSD